MWLTSDQVNHLDKDSLIDFLEKKIQENHHLDYKRALSPEDPKSPEKRKLEFLKDVTAFANANGGDIIIGVNEPDDASSIDDQIVGVENGEQTAQSLERMVADGTIDPRISGLIIKAVKVDDLRDVIIVHIPPSMGKPHMIYPKEQKSFYIRHTESSQRMTSYDIRQAVLNSASAELQAREYLEKMRREYEAYYIGTEPYYIFHGMPLVRPESPLDILDEKVIRALTMQQSSFVGRKAASIGTVYTCPTIDGVKGVSRYDENHLREFHRNGYISATYKFNEFDRSFNEKSPYTINSENEGGLFEFFSSLCDVVLSSSQFDAPYAMQCLLINSKGIYFIKGQEEHPELMKQNTKGPYQKKNIEWPLMFRKPGQKFKEITDQWFILLHNAFGLEK